MILYFFQGHNSGVVKIIILRQGSLYFGQHSLGKKHVTLNDFNVTSMVKPLKHALLPCQSWILFTGCHNFSDTPPCTDTASNVTES